MTRFLPLVLGVVVAAVCGRLGVWQLDRLGERRDRNSVIERQMGLPAVMLPADRRIDGSTDRWRRAVASGTFDFDHQIVVMARSYQGAPGVHVVTPLLLESALVVLVERGWAPSGNAKDVDLAALVEPDRATVSGVLLPPALLPEGAIGDGWPRYARGAAPALVQGEYAQPVLPLVLRRTEPPSPTSAGLRPVPVPELSDGPHLSYAVQWFSFGLIALVGGGILVVRGGRPARSTA